jgi:tripartite-type tricarboxylate transporter receptor subunit TctC
MRDMKAFMIAGLPLFAVLCIQPAHAQDSADYPSKSVHILVGFTPGGGPDITARYIAQKLGEAWKRLVIVDNRPGAGGTLAAGMDPRRCRDVREDRERGEHKGGIGSEQSPVCLWK